MDFLTVKETAELLRVSQITVRRYIASGRLPAVRVGRGIRVRREEIEGFVRPIAAGAGDQGADSLGELPFLRESIGDIVDIGRPGKPTNIAEHKDEYIADAIADWDLDEDDKNSVEVVSPSSPTGVAFVPEPLLGIPTSEDDPLWAIVGIASSDERNDVASNKHKYLAEAILTHKSME